MNQHLNNHVILGIDPGSLRTGFGIIAVDHDKQVRHIAHGTIFLEPKKAIDERLRDLALDLVLLIEKYQPNKAVVENVFMHKNARSALMLGQARGAILAILGLKQIKTFDLSPTAIKSIVAGRGRAKKFQLAQIVALELGITVPVNEDASDALAAALASIKHLF